ncbi:uncharacterized protein LOC135323368 [Camelus dromedarius]|uniref:uncharacterized protein LOC135323368 n=1 Tax=Camelus dromedarius TaxID=9838 RepID=UPI0031195F02
MALSEPAAVVRIVIHCAHAPCLDPLRTHLSQSSQQPQRPGPSGLSCSHKDATKSRAASASTFWETEPHKESTQRKEIFAAVTVWESRRPSSPAQPGSTPPAALGSEANTSEDRKGRGEVSIKAAVEFGGLLSEGVLAICLLTVTSEPPNCEQTRCGVGVGGGGAGLAGRPTPQCIALPGGRNSCRTLCSRTAALLGPSDPGQGLGGRPEQGPRKPSAGQRLGTDTRSLPTHLQAPSTHQRHHPSCAPHPGAAWKLGPVQLHRPCSSSWWAPLRPPQLPAAAPTAFSGDHPSCVPVPAKSPPQLQQPAGSTLGTVPG